jgi:glucokinase
VEGRRLLRSAAATLPSQEFRDLPAALTAFLLSPRPPIQAAAFGIAGPVRGGKVQTTNLPWVVEADALARFLGLTSVRLLNDVEAMAWGIEAVDPSDLVTIQPGEPDPAGACALIAAGTGLGEAMLFRHAGKLWPVATEGGHADFAPIDAEMDAFLGWMRLQQPHVSVERVASGLGLANLYRFFHDPAHGGEMAHAPRGADLGAVVAREAERGTCGGCGRAFGMFLRCLGAEAGNLALKTGATGGLYLGGGVVARNVEALKDGRFLRAFRDKGRFEGYMEALPVHAIVDPATPLMGAALAAARGSGLLP